MERLWGRGVYNWPQQSKSVIWKGVDSEDDVFGLYASNQGRVSFKGKTKDKKRNSRIALFDTGGFYKTFDVKVSNDGFKITANDKKGDDSLTEKYGKEILGLTDESKRELIDKILPILIKDVREELAK